jgi:predicted transcriptional regulator
VARSASRLDLRVSSAGDALDRFEAAWNRMADGTPVKLEILSFADLPLLLRTLSPARWELLMSLRDKPAASIYELAKRLGRDYKNVHTDVTRLAELGLIEKGEDLRVPWDSVRAQFNSGSGS